MCHDGSDAQLDYPSLFGEQLQDMVEDIKQEPEQVVNTDFLAMSNQKFDLLKYATSPSTLLPQATQPTNLMAAPVTAPAHQQPLFAPAAVAQPVATEQKSQQISLQQILAQKHVTTTATTIKATQMQTVSSSTACFL